jgi:20S proteasome alpha/beta subunit
MTVVFGLVTDEFVFLAADGRQSNAYEIQTDEAEKIAPINDTLAAAVLGAVIGSDLALDFASKHIASSDQAEAIEKKIQEGVFIGAKYVMDLIRPGDPSLSRIKVGMILGGLDAIGPYLVGGLFGTMMDRPSTVLCRGTGLKPSYIVLGGEDANAENYFANEILRIIQTSSKNYEALLEMLLQAVKATVQHTSSLDKTVGGRIQYRLHSTSGELRTGFLE